MSWGHLSISAISQLLLARFGPNFKQRVQGTYTTDYNCHHGICPGNICPGDICPYQQYLSCYWSDLDQILIIGSWERRQQITTVTMTFVWATFVLGTFVHNSNISISKLNTSDFSLVYHFFTRFSSCLLVDQALINFLSGDQALRLSRLKYIIAVFNNELVMSLASQTLVIMIALLENLYSHGSFIKTIYIHLSQVTNILN